MESLTKAVHGTELPSSEKNTDSYFSVETIVSKNAAAALFAVRAEAKPPHNTLPINNAQTPPANLHRTSHRPHNPLTLALANRPAAAPTSSSITHGSATASTVHPSLSPSSAGSLALPNSMSYTHIKSGE